MLKSFKMLAAAFCAAICIMPVQTGAFAASDSFYVDPVNGSDSGTGSLYSPYKTIKKAQSAVRSQPKNVTGDVTVYLKGGTYNEGLITFDDKDSGSAVCPVTWKAYADEKPIISGGKTISGWSLYDAEKNIYSAPAKGIETRQLTVNGKAAVRARSEGNILPKDTSYDNGVTGYVCSDTEMTGWRNQKNIEFVYKNEYTSSRCPVNSVTKKDGKVTIEMQQPAWRNVRVVKTGKLSVTLPWYIENAYELLDSPGEFYLDIAGDTFYYIPRIGEDMNSAEVIAGVDETLLSVKGSSLDKFVHDVSFEGISFKYTTWLRPGKSWGFADNQNATVRDTEKGVRDLFPPAMVEAERARNVNFRNCEFARSGSIALKMTEGIDSCEVSGNHIYDCAGQGIVMGEITCQDKENPRYNPKDIRLYMIRDKVNNNYVHNVGMEYMSAAAISIGFLIDSEVCHNEIADVPYSGFHIGYGFQTYSFEQGTVFRNVKIKNNFIMNTMNNEIFDGGSIYILGASGGNEDNMIEVSGNYIKDQNDVYADIYLDNGSSYCDVHDNVIDQYNYPKGHSGDGKLYWTFANTEAHGHRVYNSYINIPDVSRIHAKATDCTIEAPHIYPDSKWPKEALDIIDNSGLESGYRDKLGGIRRDAVDKIVCDDKLKLDNGEEIRPEISVFSTDGRSIDAQLSFEAENPSVVSISSDGTFKALNNGRTEVKISAAYNGEVKTKKITVFAGDRLSGVSLKDVPKNLFEGNKFHLSAGFTTEFNDNEIEDAEITYSTSNPEIITVDSENFLIGISEGEATLYVTAAAQNDSYTAQFPIKVYKSGAFKNLGYNTMSVENIIKDKSGWLLDASNPDNDDYKESRYTYSNGTAKFRTYGSGTNGFGIYTGSKYLNEIFNMNYCFNAVNGYVMLAARVQCENEGPLSKADGSGCYLVVVKADSIELQRVINGKSYMLYGKLTNNAALGGERDNRLMPHRETLNLKFGAVNYNDSVVLSLTADGQTVFEYFDDSPDAIKTPGCFGMVVRTGSLDLSAPAEDEARMATAASRAEGTAYFTDALTHWAMNDIAYLAGKKILTGYQDGTFRPDDSITRAEFCTALSQCCGYEVKKYNGQFKDISGSEWYADKVFTVLDARVVPYEMQEDGYFYPDRCITREEVAAILRNSLLYVNGIVMKQGDISVYPDIDEASEWAKSGIGAMTGEKFMQGDDNGYCRPKSTITRAETAVMLRRLLNITE